MSNLIKNKVQKVEISEKTSGQRLDNFLRKILKGVPHSLIYKIIRDGQVRVNSKRVLPKYRVELNDIIRVPPVDSQSKSMNISHDLFTDLNKIIVYENNDFIIINKPSGLPVQPGTKVKNDLISILKSHKSYQDSHLVHRLDKGTSGLMIIGKNYKSASDLGKLFINKKVFKSYYALLDGMSSDELIIINSSLMKSTNNTSNKVLVHKEGKVSSTKISRIKQFKDSFLAKIDIDTGRMHQIRVHSSNIGHPVCGDTEYGNRNVNEKFRKIGLRRIFLHSYILKFNYNGKHSFKKDLPDDLQLVVNTLKNAL